MKWYVVENRSGSDAFRCRASSPEAALRAARLMDPSSHYVRVREAYPSEIAETVGARA